MDLKINTLVIEEDRTAHIARHGVTIEEVLEIISGNYIFIQGKYKRWQLIGKTRNKRFLAVIVGERQEQNTYGLVTARPASRKERNFYKEFTTQLGGEENEKERK